MEMKSRRGIFLTNLVSKVFETIILKNDESAMYPWQNGGRKKRSTIDNVLIIMGVIDNNRRLKKNTYLIFADAEKCFDKLWLEDCLINMQELGTREREIATIYKMNQMIKITIDTPVGRTQELLANVVKQGSVYAAKLCCSSTGKVNHMSIQKSYCLTPEINLQAVVYVDDIVGGGTSEVICGIGNNLKEMEDKKGYTFGIDKTNYMIVQTGKEKYQELNIIIKRGKVERVPDYKFLGLIIDESGTI